MSQNFIECRRTYNFATVFYIQSSKELSAIYIFEITIFIMKIALDEIYLNTKAFRLLKGVTAGAGLCSH